RAIALTGVALLRKGRPDAAQRCFRELPETTFSPHTAALMWRLGEALAVMGNDRREAGERREKWVTQIKRLPEHLQRAALHALEQLALPPHERCQVLSSHGTEVMGSEAIGWMDANSYQLFIDVASPRAMA